ncbi:hypothetical protein GCM10009430_32380 [Aquimarina litoralis]|uniref:Uncharacterized protein n=1 Tax=Aquimarina litoralis TaxID=584605 RepID=A0ABN1J1K1_9FLAO
MVNYTKLFRIMTFLLVMSLVITSCEKNEEVQSPQIQEVSDEVIENDADFIALRDLLLNNVDLIKNSMIEEGVTLTEFKNVVIEDDQAKMQEFFEANQKEISQNFILAKTHYESLVAKYPIVAQEVNNAVDYSNMSKQDRISMFDGIDKSNFLSTSSAAKNDRRQCSWRYYTCLISIGAPAFACVVGAGSTGVGLVISYSCIIGFGAGAILCADSFCWPF